MTNPMPSRSDFGTGSVRVHLLRLALPLILAQLINVLYNVVDRIYIGHMASASMDSLTGIGLAMPVITILTAFASLFSMGGAPLFSMARGAGRGAEAERVLGNVTSMLLLTGTTAALGAWVLRRPILYLLGASDATYPYASAYLSIYLLGTGFMMTSLGLNPFINAQGFGLTGMLTVSIGAVLNLILDPLFIFVLHMGVRGAALATILAQMVSALWVLRFLTGPKAIVPLKRSAMAIDWPLVGRITALGMAGFIVYLTNATVQIVCNTTLQRWGGDLYIGVMTLISSVREVLSMPVMGTSDAAKPILSFNYGAGKFDRVRECIRFMSWFCIAISTVLWGLVFVFPQFFLKLFSSDPELIRAGVPALHAYFFGFFLMTLQFAGQTTFQALGKAKRAIFFSLFRKVVIVVPLTVLLPTLGFGVMGVFMAEPVSNLIGGGACFLTMYFSLYRRLEGEE